MSRIYTVNSRKFDGTIRRSWKCEFISRDELSIDLKGTFEHRVEHKDLGVVEAGTISQERFYLDRWFNCFIFQWPTGAFSNYYINICMPPDVGHDTIDYVDLDIDLIIWPDGHWRTVDLDEFEANRLALRYPKEVVMKAMESLTYLEKVVASTSTSDIQKLHYRF
jgi:protein associated with RNAse G/E